MLLSKACWASRKCTLYNVHVHCIDIHFGSIDLNINNNCVHLFNDGTGCKINFLILSPPLATLDRQSFKWFEGCRCSYYSNHAHKLAALAPGGF